MHYPPIRRTVRFNPRPLHWRCGTECIPNGLYHRPYHPDFEDKDVVLDDMDEREFESSVDLEEYLGNFYRNIKPLCIDLPPLRDVPDEDIPAIAARFKSKTEPDTLLSFRRRVGVFVGERFAALPPDLREKVTLPELQIPRLTEAEILKYRVALADMLSMQSELIELKVWVSMFSEIGEYCGTSLSIAAHSHLIYRLSIITDVTTLFSNFLHRFSASESRTDNKALSKRDNGVPQDGVPQDSVRSTPPLLTKVKQRPRPPP
ncbi:hypothetical protein B0H16DRAFT_1709254 [Mycena metata]|uniref:Uncharacterized protein n=1 Tax=Mycena metata TaxID=1033252 RepID=A0AAD7KH21_9AGAR|nr:hypothetical protein B0H16DRAFT_1709254 [Mycena metata]